MTTVRLKVCATLNAEPPHFLSPPRPYIALEDMESGTGRLLTETDLPIRSPDAPGVSAAEPGDVLFGKLRPYLAKSMLVTEPAFASNELMCLRPGGALDARWFSYLAQSRPFIGWAVATSDGVKMPRTSWEKVSDYRLEIAPLAQQRAIADYLDAETTRINALIAKKRRMIDLIEERREAFLEQVFEPWDRVPLKRLARRIDVGIAEATTHAYAEEGVPLIRSTNIRRAGLDVSDLLYIEPWFAERNRSKYIHAGDILTVRTGEAGASAVVPAELEGSHCFTQLITTLERGHLPEVVCAALNCGDARRYFAKAGWGSAQANISVPLLARAPIPIIPLSKQEQVLQWLTGGLAAMDALLPTLRRQIDLLIEHRLAIISAAVTGELHVPGVAA